VAGEQVSASTLELLSWIARSGRTYVEAMESWGSWCPRHSVWEDAVADGLVRVVRIPGAAARSEVALTQRGRAILDTRRTAARD
jgi:hypothetical protein